MNPVQKAMIGGVVRWALGILGTYGVELGNDQIEQVVNAALIIVPLVWSLRHKLKVNEKILKVSAGADA